jgi:hypothetical protein
MFYRLSKVASLLILEVFGINSSEVAHLDGVVNKFSGGVLVDEKDGGLLFGA